MTSVEHLYVLKCSHDKWYVGRTTRGKDDRFAEHLLGTGAEWTRLHAPEFMTEWIPYTHPLLEDERTVRLMKVYGIENVRGGSFVSPVLPDHQRATLDGMLRSASGACHQCGSLDHYFKSCPRRVPEAKAIADSVASRSTVQASSSCRPDVLTRCKRKTTSSSSSTYEHKMLISTQKMRKRSSPSAPTTTTQQQRCHNNHYRKCSNGRIVLQNNCCYRCGRDSHWVEDCYATRHISGSILSNGR